MRPNERVQTTPGHVLQWYGPNCGTSVLTVRAYHFFWSRLFVWAENVLVALKAEALSLLWGRGFLLCGVAVAVREFKYLWACLAKATFIIIRLMCTPERQSQNHPESSYWKQRWGPFQQVVKLRKVFVFCILNSAKVRTGSQMGWRFKLLVFRQDTDGKRGKKSLGDVEVWVRGDSDRLDKPGQTNKNIPDGKESCFSATCFKRQ